MNDSITVDTVITVPVFTEYRSTDFVIFARARHRLKNLQWRPFRAVLTSPQLGAIRSTSLWKERPNFRFRSKFFTKSSWILPFKQKSTLAPNQPAAMCSEKNKKTFFRSHSTEGGSRRTAVFCLRRASFEFVYSSRRWPETTPASVSFADANPDTPSENSDESSVQSLKMRAFGLGRGRGWRYGMSLQNLKTNTFGRGRGRGRSDAFM